MAIEKARKVGTLMTVAGAGMALHHQANYGRWFDKHEQQVCHGKAGLFLLVMGLLLLGESALGN